MRKSREIKYSQALNRAAYALITNKREKYARIVKTYYKSKGKNLGKSYAIEEISFLVGIKKTDPTPIFITDFVNSVIKEIENEK